MPLSISEKLFALHDDIRSVMVLDAKGAVVDLQSRTKRPVSKEFVTRLGSAWMALMLGLLTTTQDQYGKANYMLLDYHNMRLVGILHRQGYVVFTARHSLPVELIGKVATQLRSGS